MFAPAYMGRKRRGEAPPKLLLRQPPISTDTGKAIETVIIGPCTLVRTWGTRPFPTQSSTGDPGERSRALIQSQYRCELRIPAVGLRGAARNSPTGDQQQHNVDDLHRRAHWHAGHVRVANG